MQQAIEQAITLNQRIRESGEYQNYLDTLHRLREQPDLYYRFNEFRRRNYELQFQEPDGSLYDGVLALVKEYEGVLHESVVNDFRLAEQRLNVLMREIYGILSQDLDFDYEFLEK